MTQHILERRASAIATAIQKQRLVVAEALKPDGTRPPFTTQMSEPEALAWWQKNRYSNFGQRVLANMAPMQVMELDQALSQANEPQQGGFNDIPQ